MGYDDSFYDRLGGTTQAENYIAASWVHLQTYFCHYSLGSFVLVERLPNIKHYQGVKIQDNERSTLDQMFHHTTKDIGDADLMLYLGYKPNQCSTCTSGLAYRAKVCKTDYHSIKKKCSINLHVNYHTLTAKLMGHEIGHNLGMFHDFDSMHGGDSTEESTNACNKQGFMSYNLVTGPNQWSECSKEDFTEHYNNVTGRLGLQWCLPGM